MLPRWMLPVLVMMVIAVGSVPARSWAHPSPTSTPASDRPASAAASSTLTTAQTNWATAQATWTSAQTAAGGGALIPLTFVTLGLALIPRYRRARPVRLIALALLLVVAGYDGAIHSVHHLNDPAGANRCAAGAAAEHVGAAGIAGPPIAISVMPAPERAPVASRAIASGTAPAAVAGRSPPA